MRAIIKAADRVDEIQRADEGCEGTWTWTVGPPQPCYTNLTGATALGLLEAYNVTKIEDYLGAAEEAAEFIMTHLGIGATGTQLHTRTTAADLVFLFKLAEVIGDDAYATRALLEWDNLISVWPTAGDLDNLFRAINRRSAWDIAFFQEAASYAGDSDWADDAAAILADTSDTFYYGTDTWWYALNVAASVRALLGTGYYSSYRDAIVDLYDQLKGVVGPNGVDGYIQDTAYVVIALSTAGGNANQEANYLAKWLSAQQETSGGWLDGGTEYPEVNGEALRAIANTIGSNVAIDGFKPGKFKGNMSWRRIKIDKEGSAEPF